jgi:lipopolysaccharide transport system permease protein
LRREGRSAIGSAEMSIALQHDLSGEVTLELSPGQSLRERQRSAVRDLRDAAALWRLCWTLALLDIRLRYRGSMLGPFWLTLSTGAMVSAMGVLYSELFHIGLHEYLPFLTVSLVLWGFVATLFSEACYGYTAADGMIRSIRMPYTLYAARTVLRNLMVLAHNILVVVAVDLFVWAGPGAEGALALPGLALWLIDALAITIMLGALCARFRDIPPIVASVVQMAFFVTPVLWKPQLVGEHQWLLPLNPFFDLLDIIRGPLLGEIPSPATYLAALCYSFILCAAAWFLFARVRGRIAFWV